LLRAIANRQVPQVLVVVRYSGHPIFGYLLTEPAINRARGSNSGKAKLLPTKIAKERVIQAIKDGLQVEDAMALVDRSRHTYIEWRRSDESFKVAIDRLREQASAARRRKGEAAVVPDFPEFSATYLGHEVP
jgi:hypothetical protein